jgi:hypothetical protein
MGTKSTGMIKLAAILCIATSAVCAQTSKQIEGAWMNDSSGFKQVSIFTGKFFSLTTYDLAGKTFISTRGGSWTIDGGKMIWTDEFNTSSPQQVGKITSMHFSMSTPATELKLGSRSWKRLDDTTPGKLAGAWLITGRNVSGAMQPITPGARRTMKILSGTRFQWIAYNTETKEFFGTGGGTYTTKDGKYTEHIEFFSRDASRVGMELSFEFEIDSQGHWKHTGFSSKGDPIDEVWTRREVLGL